MNEEAIKVAYELFVADGYTKSIDEFKTLMLNNEDGRQVAFDLFTADGYTKGIDEFGVLMGASPVKKKEDTVSVLEDGSSGLQEPSVQVEEEQIDFDPTAGVTALKEAGLQLPTPPPRDFTQPFLGPVGMDDPMSVEEQQELFEGYVSPSKVVKSEETLQKEAQRLRREAGKLTGVNLANIRKEQGEEAAAAAIAERESLMNRADKLLEGKDEKFEQEKEKRNLEYQTQKEKSDKDRKIGYVLKNLDDAQAAAVFQNLASTRGEIADDELQQLVDLVDKKTIEKYGQEEYDLVQKIGGNVLAEDLFYGGNISTSPSVVDELVVEGDEIATVSNLNNEFDGTPFTFSKSILGSDAVEVSVLDISGVPINSKIVRLDDGAKASQQLRDFMAKSNLSKGNKEFLEGKINGKDISNLPMDKKQLINYKYMLENKDKFSAGKGAGFSMDANAIMRFVNENPDFFPPEELQSIKLQLDEALANQYKEDEQLEGSFLGSLGESFLKGATQTSKFTTNLGIDIGGALMPSMFMPSNSFSAINFDENGNRLSDSEVIDRVKKEGKREMIAAMDNAVESSFTGTTQAWMNSDERNDLAKALNFVFESLGVVASVGANRLALAPKAAKTLSGLAFFAYAANGIEDEMAGTEYDGLSEWKKKLISFPYGVMIGQLEKLGWEASTGAFGNKVFDKISRGIISKTMKSVPKNASPEVIKTAIENNTKAAIADGTIKIISGALSEGLVEGTQELGDVTLKNIVNGIMEKDYFANAPDLSTKKGWLETIKQMKESGYYGLLAGGSSAGGGGIIQGTKKRLQRDADIREYNEQKQAHTDKTLREKLIFNINTRQQAGEITAEQAEAQKEQVAEDAATFEQIPDEGLSNKNKIESFVLITERNNLEKEIAGKNEELVTKQRDRIRDINAQLTIIGTQDATTEQEASDLDEDQQAPDVQEMEEGTPQPEPEQVTAEEVEVKEELKPTEEQREKLAKKAVRELKRENRKTRRRGFKGDKIKGTRKKYEPTQEEIDARVDELFQAQQQEDQEVLDLEAAIEGEVKEGRALPSETTAVEEVTGAVPEDVAVEEEVTTEEAPLVNPKVVISGTPDGYQTLSSNNTTEAESESIKDARGDKTFEEDGFRITKREDGSSEVSYRSKVKVKDRVGRPGFAMATVIVPEGSPVNKQQIQEAFDNKLSEIIEGNRAKKLGGRLSDLTAKQNQQLADAVVEAVSTKTTSDATQMITPVPTKTETKKAPTKAKVDGVVMSDKKRSKKEQALVDRAKRAAKALKKFGKGGVTVELHDDTDSFKKATGQDGRGAYDKTSNTIHINLSKANNTTIAHEAFHAVLLQRVKDGNTAKVTKTMFDAVRKAGKGDTRVMEYTTTKEVDGKTETVTETATVEEYLEDFASNYEENVQDEEKLAELTGLLASSYVNLAPAPKSKVRQWVDKVMTPIAKGLGIKVDQFTKTDQGVVDLLNAISAKVTIGEEIQEGDVKVLEEIETKPETKKGKAKKINWTKKQSKPQGESTQKTKEVQAKIRDLVKRYEGGEITIEEYNKQADDIIPVRMKEVFVDPVTQEELMVGLKSKNTQTNSPIKEGADVSLRIDIPFMKRTGKASVTIHERKSPKDITGRVLSYRGSAVIKDVEFLVNPKQSLAFATDDKVHKSSNLGRMGGKLVDIGKTIEEQNEAAKKLSQQAIDEGWTQVGINPAKHSYFYDRSTGKPLKSADRVVQVGDLIYAENAKTTTIYDDMFIVKGKTDKKGGPLRFQKEGVSVSENEIIFDKVPPKKVLSSILKSLQGKRRSDNIQFDDNVVDIFSDYVKGNEVNINAENYPIEIQDALEGDDMTYGEIANMLRVAGLYDTNAAALKGISEIGKVAGVDIMRQVQEAQTEPSMRFQADFSDIVSGMTFVYDKNGERFNKLERDGFITRDKKIEDYEGQIIFLHQPDAAFSGMIYKDGELLVEGSGGMYYPIKFHEDGFFWASTEGTAKSMANSLNEAMEANGGKLLMGLTTAPQDKLLSSTTMSNAVMDLFLSKAFDKNFKLTENQIKVALRKAANDLKVTKKTNKKTGKTVTTRTGLDLKIPASATLADIKSKIEEALGFNNSTFKDRKNFATELIGSMSEVINRNPKSVKEFGSLFSEGIQNKYFKGVTKTGKLKISKANMVQALSEMFTEPMLKEDVARDKGGQLYAILEVDSKVKPVASKKHGSYPFALETVEDGAKVKINILKDRQNWFDVFEDPETDDIVEKDRLKEVFPTSGASTSGLKVNTSKVSKDLSETAMREQKSLMQIGRYYNANNQGFFPSQVNSYQLKQDLEQIGFGLKRAKNGAYYATRNGRKVNPFPPEPSRYRFQRDDIGIVEEKSFTSKNTVADIIIAARREGFKDKAIRFYILKRRSDIKEENGKPLRAKTVDDMLRVPANILENVPDSFKEIEGGAAAGLRLYQKVEQLRDKLLAANARIKSPKLSDAGIKQKIKEKREELKKKKLSDEQLAKELDAFTKREYKNNKARKEMKTESEIMDEVIEFLEKQPEYIEAGDKGKKTPSLLQSKMQAELQATIAFRPSREVAQNLSKLKNRARAMDKAGRDLQEIKRQLRATLRKSLPKAEYSKPEVMRLLGEIAKVDASNLQDVIGEIESLIVKKNVQILEGQIDKLLGTKVAKSEAGRRKGKFGYDEAARLEAINNNIVKNKKVDGKLVKYTAEEIMDKNERLRRELNEIMRQPELSLENINKLTDLQIAININSANLMKAQLGTKERISPNIIAPLVTAQESLQELIEEGRSKFKVELQEAHQKYQEQFTMLWEEITGEKIDMSDPDVRDKINARLKESSRISKAEKAKNRSKFRNVLTNMYDSIVRGFNKAEDLSGLMNKISIMPGELAGGRIQEMITDRVDESTRVYKGRMMIQEDVIENKMKEIFGRKWRKRAVQLNDTKTNGITLETKDEVQTISQNQLAYLYNQYKDPANAGSFKAMFGENYEQEMSKLISQLDPQLKEWADWQVDEFFPSVYEYYNDTYRKIYRTDMPWNQFYAGRIYREGFEQEPLDMLANSSIFQTSVGAASTLERKVNNLPIQAMNINNALTSYIQDMEYFAAHAETVRDIDKMFTNKDVRKYLKNIYGDDINNLIDSMIKKVSAKGQQKFKMASFINKSMNAFIISKLAFNPVVFIKQLTSIPTYANDIGYANWIKYSKLGSTLSQRRSAIMEDYNEVIKNSVYLQDRAKGLNIRNAIAHYEDHSNSIIDKSFGAEAQRIAMMLTKSGDKAAIMLGGLPNYRYYKAQYKKQNPKATEQEVIDYAIRKFERDTKKTQQSSDIQDRDYYQTDDPLMRSFNMFMTTPKQYLRKEIDAFRNLGRKIRAMDSKAGKGTIGQNLRQLAMYHVMMPALFQWAALGFPVDMDDEDKADMAGAMLLGNLNALFIVGDLFTMTKDVLLEKPWGGTPETLSIIQWASSVLRKWSKWQQKIDAKKPDPTKIDDARYDFYGTILEGVGIPARQGMRYYDNYTKLFTEKMDTPEKIRRILNYSDYTIEGKKDDKKKKKDSDGKRTKAEQRKFESELKKYNPDAYRSMGYEERDRLEEQLKMSQDPSFEMEKKRQKEELDRLNREIYQSYN